MEKLYELHAPRLGRRTPRADFPHTPTWRGPRRTTALPETKPHRRSADGDILGLLEVGAARGDDGHVVRGRERPRFRDRRRRDTCAQPNTSVATAGATPTLDSSTVDHTVERPIDQKRLALLATTFVTGCLSSECIHVTICNLVEISLVARSTT